MVSRTLVQMIEDSGERITDWFIRQLRADDRLVQFHTLPESELRDRAHDVLKNLGRWLVAGHEGEIAHRYEALGRHRYEESIPLYEVVRALHTLRETIQAFVREQGIGQTSMQLYAEEEFEHLMGLFFDGAVYHAVHGYETALRQATHT